MSITKICLCGQTFQQESQVENDFCQPCIAQHEAYCQDLQQSYLDARIRRVEQEQEAYEAWRTQRYQQRLREQAEQQARIDAYRESIADPDPDGWQATLRYLAGVGGGA